MPTFEENPFLKVHRVLDYRGHAEDFPLGVWESHIKRALNSLIVLSHGVSTTSGWHHDPDTGEPIHHNVGERLMLMVSEISEAMEAHRKSLMDDKLPNRLGVEVELADCLHRIFDFAGKHGLDLAGAYVEKAAFNLTRPDHKPENRLKDGGKNY